MFEPANLVGIGPTLGWIAPEFDGSNYLSRVLPPKEKKASRVMGPVKLVTLPY